MTINFTFASFALSNTRSPHEDTDYAAAALRHNGALLPVQVRRIGNVNNGVHSSITCKVGFEFSVPNTYQPTDEFVFSYLVINHGGGSTQHVTADCVAAMTNTSLTTFSAPDAKIVDQGHGHALPFCLTTGLRAADDLKTWWNTIKGSFQGTDTDTCDGPVVIDRFSFTGASLSQLILASSFSLIYLGMDSAVGCGSNSHYSAQWNVTVS